MSELLGLGFWFLEKLSMKEKVRGRWYVSVSYFVCEGKRWEGDKGKTQIGPGGFSSISLAGDQSSCARKMQTRKQKKKAKTIITLSFPSHPFILPSQANEPPKPPAYSLTQTLSHIRLLLSTISRLLERNTSPYSLASEPVLLAVGVHQPVSPRAEVSNEEWEDLCRECGGWEWVDGEVSRDEGNGGRNEFGGT